MRLFVPRRKQSIGMELGWRSVAATCALCLLAFFSGLLFFWTPPAGYSDNAFFDNWWPGVNKIDHENVTGFDFVKTRYPFAVRNHFLTNYILYGNGLRSKLNPLGHHGDYVSGVKVFVHMSRTSGGRLVECLEQLIVNMSMQLAPRTTEEFRVDWDDPEALNQRYRHRFDFHVGGDTFGMCDSIHWRMCSYFMVVRDPLHQLASSYYHCKTSMADPLCSVVNANDVTLRDWIVVMGGALFEKFLFDRRVCEKSLSDLVTSSVQNKVISPSRVPCWYKRKMWARNIPESDRKELLKYIIDHLDSFFAVLGVYEDMASTLKTFQYVYGLPFSECTINNRISCVGCMKDNSHINHRTILSPAEEDVLRNDPLVQDALYFDNKIYERVWKIVSEQNRHLFNRLK